MIIFWVGVGISLSAYGAKEYITFDFINESKNITQGELAVILVHSIGLESELPTAPILGDYIKLLEKNGIRPLGGWVRNKMVTNGDFAVVLACAMGIDMRLISPQEICEVTIREHIQKMWEVQYRRDGYRENLEDLLQDRRFFPDGPPKSPYGYPYVDKDGDYIVDPVAIMPGRPELHPTVKYIYTLRRRGITLEGPPTKILTLRLIKSALRSPIFRSAPIYVLAHGYEERVEEVEAIPYVTPITNGGP